MRTFGMILVSPIILLHIIVSALNNLISFLEKATIISVTLSSFAFPISLLVWLFI